MHINTVFLYLQVPRLLSGDQYRQHNPWTHVDMYRCNREIVSKLGVKHTAVRIPYIAASSGAEKNSVGGLLLSSAIGLAYVGLALMGIDNQVDV